MDDTITMQLENSESTEHLVHIKHHNGHWHKSRDTMNTNMGIECIVETCTSIMLKEFPCVTNKRPTDVNTGINV